jgi:hypothetical protein
MRIDQRNAGAVYTTTAGAGIYMVDRWAISPQGGGGTAQRVSGSSLGTQYALQLNGAAGITEFQAFSRLEAVNVYDLVGQTVTYSFRGISSTAGLSVNWYINYPSAVDDYTSQNTIISGTWSIGTTAANYSATFPIPSGYTNGLTVYIAPNNFTSGTFQFSNVQLEKGSQATSFDTRDYGRELIMCQRYYQKSYDIETAAGTATRTGFINWNWGSMTSYATAYIVLPVRMRASPTVTNYNPDLTNTVGGRYWNGSAEVAFTGSLSGYAAYSSGFTFAMDATSRSNILFQWTASAEF